MTFVCGALRAHKSEKYIFVRMRGSVCTASASAKAWCTRPPGACTSPRVCTHTHAHKHTHAMHTYRHTPPTMVASGLARRGKVDARLRSFMLFSRSRSAFTAFSTSLMRNALACRTRGAGWRDRSRDQGEHRTAHEGGIHCATGEIGKQQGVCGGGGWGRACGHTPTGHDTDKRRAGVGVPLSPAARREGTRLAHPRQHAPR